MCVPFRIIPLFIVAMTVPAGAQFWIAGTAGAIYYSAGNVGIGTATPGSKLDVQTSASGYASLANLQGATDPLDGATRLRIWNPRSSLLVNVYGSASPYLLANAAGIFSEAPTSSLMVGTSTSTPLYLTTNNNLTNPPVTVSGTGYVGIGTTSPQHLLHVAGIIGAQEVIVSTTGADYVFGPAYRLQPLSEVANYISEHHHLPEIPSEAEVSRRGLSVGEMQTRLLAKIEELTLHMIEMEKENLELRERVVRLEGVR